MLIEFYRRGIKGEEITNHYKPMVSSVLTIRILWPFFVFRGFFKGTSYMDRTRSIRAPDFDSDSYLSTSLTSINRHHSGPKQEGGSANWGQKTEANFRVPLSQVRAWLPHRFFQNWPARAKWAGKGRRWTGIRNTRYVSKPPKTT